MCRYIHLGQIFGTIKYGRTNYLALLHTVVQISGQLFGTIKCVVQILIITKDIHELSLLSFLSGKILGELSTHATTFINFLILV